MRSWRGKHSRDYVQIDLGGYHNEYEVIHEVKSENYGIFGIVERYDDELYVFWRPNRNCTTDWKIVVIHELVEVSYSTYKRKEPIEYKSLEDAIASIEHWQTSFEYPEKREKYRPRDSQKSKMYRWEHIMGRDLGKRVEGKKALFTIPTELNIKRDHGYLQNFLNKICQDIGMKKPELKFRSAGSCSWGGLFEIRLLPSHCTQLVLTHEIAHAVHIHFGNKTDGKKHQVHGKEFVGYYMYLLIRFCGIDKDAIVRHANDHKIKFLLPEQYWEWAKESEGEKAA
ncbi:hypothetical protein AMJ86_04750 [bacterium SM23_57]|nr:MAG: hypothetical protein AMJ86_04750 [bacterium SM23_57]